MLAPPARALVRAVPAAFSRCLRHHPASTVDVDRARSQHAGYVQALREAGISVTVLPAQDGLPDSCFVEDPALVLSSTVAVLTRSAAPSRAPEGETLRPALAAWGDLAELPAPGTLDGGDVMRVGRRLYVGCSARTSAAGIAALGALASPLGLEVVSVPLAAGLHLKSVVSLASAGLLVYQPDAIDPSVFTDVTPLPVPEELGANVLALGAGRALVSAAAPRTAALLEARGVATRLVDVGEFHKADGALTCLSLRQPHPGMWSA